MMHQKNKTRQPSGIFYRVEVFHHFEHISAKAQQDI